ncbi:hypothetical protein EPUS_07837 [Endocarpon pusillum Z07020]|uniref:Uncharacterized protein n=1 Tax=Endocarpon pusillum (strain Z07020 / HMAS-L-300199) TaxID=1263415 RepID=U1GBK4_ENDPU|nr:uncharacterized protein EPUS_07837 [Endocarpon pusillum Z07020]ERF69433.1 hypothetical protein EPUS_07837 [Endocarpon pusillum Z07020]
MFRAVITLSTLILVHLHHVRALPSKLNIFLDPAPPPEEGPPLSASALRDPSKLKFEIIGIILSYLIFTSGLLILLFTVGKRLRRNIQSSNRSLEMEMVKPSVNQAAFGVDESPTSPIKCWPSPVEPEVKAWTSPSRNHYYHQSQTSVSTFDDRVIESDKIRNQNEMERLYAAVMAHDAQKTEETSPVKSPRKYPPEFQHLRTSNGTTQPINHVDTSPTEPKSPVSSRASSRLAKVSPLSIFQSNHSRTSSAASQRQRPRRISIRDLPISPPMGTPDLKESVAYNEEQPLSPRMYTPGPPPPTPGHKSAAATAREAEKKVSFRAPAPSPLHLRTTTGSSNSLPFRQNYATSLQSAPSTKTTFVERRESLLNPGPRTGAPVPYSPYMPYTPITPITPGRLVTKEERKKAKKQAGLKVLAEDDLVRSDQEMWGDTWKG